MPPAPGKGIGVVANNLANLTSPGFMRCRVGLIETLVAGTEIFTSEGTRVIAGNLLDLQNKLAEKLLKEN